MQKEFFVSAKNALLCSSFKHQEMLRTIYMPDSNRINVPIPDRYIGAELEVTVFPTNEISTVRDRDIKKSRVIGILNGKASFRETNDGKITTDEFLGL